MAYPTIVKRKKTFQKKPAENIDALRPRSTEQMKACMIAQRDDGEPDGVPPGHPVPDQHHLLGRGELEGEEDGPHAHEEYFGPIPLPASLLLLRLLNVELPSGKYCSDAARYGVQRDFADDFVRGHARLYDAEQREHRTRDRVPDGAGDQCVENLYLESLFAAFEVR